MSTFTAVKLTNRIHAMDVIRGVAVLGILLMNIPIFAAHQFFLYWHDALLETTTTNGIIYNTAMIVFDGKMRGLFTLLFGAGLMLFIENKNDNSIKVADLYFKRMMCLLVFALIDAYLLLWSGDILYEYAMSGIFAFAFRTMRPRNMLLLALTMLMAVIYFSGSPFFERQEKYIEYKIIAERIQKNEKITDKQKEAHAEFVEVKGTFLPFSKEHIKNVTEDIYNREIKLKADYFTILEKNAEELVPYHTQEFFMGMWESFATILLGMALFKMGFFQYKMRAYIYKLFVFMGIPIGVLLCSFSVLGSAHTQLDLINIMETRWCSVNHVGGVGRIILTISYASAILLLCRVNWLKAFLSLFANVGRMALTNYIMQTILCSLYFYGFGLNYYGEYDAKGLLLFVICIWIIQITYSTIYLRFFKMGPLEWLWKRLTYGKDFDSV